MSLTSEGPRFWGRVQKSPGCWLWLGATCGRDGYGHFKVKGHQHKTHRVSWELANGPIPDGLQVLHNCPDGDNRRCVNPAHLWLGTHLQNIADRQAKARQARGERNGEAKLTEEQVREIRTRHARGGSSYRSMAPEFGVSHEAIRRVVNRMKWAHVE